MTIAFGRCVIGGALLALSFACSETVQPTAPSRTDAPAPTPSPTHPDPPLAEHVATFPAITRAARVYLGVPSFYSPAHGSLVASRYVLYDDGMFALQFSSANYPFFEYRGTYDGDGTDVTFHWEGWSTAGPWGATGTLTNDALTVKYNSIMSLSDFLDGVYTRAH